jgi:hypothetical protein
MHLLPNAEYVSNVRLILAGYQKSCPNIPGFLAPIGEFCAYSFKYAIVAYFRLSCILHCWSVNSVTDTDRCSSFSVYSYRVS